jgi:hypothetical protein
MLRTSSVLFNLSLCGTRAETFCARQYTRKLLGKRNLVPFLDWFFFKFFSHKDHCYWSWLYPEYQYTLKKKEQE